MLIETVHVKRVNLLVTILRLNGIKIFLSRQDQRVMNDLKRTRLSRRRMIWLLPQPSCQQVVFFSQSSCVFPVELTDGRGEETNHTMRRKSGPL
jgi:hypothetical protein